MEERKLNLGLLGGKINVCKCLSYTQPSNEPLTDDMEVQGLLTKPMTIPHITHQIHFQDVKNTLVLKTCTLLFFFLGKRTTLLLKHNITT